jgi:hypothetical protein
VRELFLAEKTRNDDLRIAENRRIDDLAAAERHALRQELDLRAEYENRLREAESKRIDAIRAVDVNAVSVASERASAAANVLANQVAASAEAMRSLVASTAATIAQQLAALTSQLTDRISLLEKSSYEGSGRSTVADPQVARLVAEVEQLRTGLAAREGRAGLSTPLLVALSSAAGGVVIFVADLLVRGVPASH